MTKTEFLADLNAAAAAIQAECSAREAGDPELRREARIVRLAAMANLHDAASDNSEYGQILAAAIRANAQPGLACTAGWPVPSPG